MTIGTSKRTGEMREVAAPLHHQVYVVLRQQISDGQYEAGKPLPSEHKLEKLFNVSRITIRRALDRLASEGLVLRQHGRGNFPQPAIAPAPTYTNLRGMLENLLAMGLKTKVDLIEFDYVTASPEVCAHLELAPGAVVQRVVRVRKHKDTPFSFLTTYVPEAVGRSYGPDDMLERPLLSLFEKAGITVARADQTITAKLADTRVAPLLGVEIGAALLGIRRVVRDQEDTPIELLEALYRPDIYEYQMSMTRSGKSPEFIWSDSSLLVR